jgi:hypothetical protein
LTKFGGNDFLRTLGRDQGKGMFATIGYRAYQNFLMPSRLGEYAQLLEGLIRHGYTFLTVAGLATGAKTGHLPALTCVIRMDVDTDLPTARKMFSIEKALGVKTTYYFRLRPFDAGFARSVAAHGSEVGFHYEELASVAKRLGLRNKAEVDAQLPAIREEFVANLAWFAQQVGFWPKTIASHGDFANRMLGLPNYYVIDKTLLERFGIIAEAYDEWVNAPIQARFSDREPPAWWDPGPPDEAVRRLVPCVYILVHPRQWRANRATNARLEIERAIDGWAYRRRCTKREVRA